MERKPRIGRPPKFETPEEIATAAEEYFAETPEEDWTITGLAIAMGTTRKSLADYEKKPAFSDTVKTAKAYIELAYEKSLRRHGRSGDIFALKNFDWKDKTESESKHQFLGADGKPAAMSININFVEPGEE